MVSLWTFGLGCTTPSENPEFCHNGVDDNGNGLVDCDDTTQCAAEAPCTSEQPTVDIGAADTTIEIAAAAHGPKVTEFVDANAQGCAVTSCGNACDLSSPTVQVDCGDRLIAEIPNDYACGGPGSYGNDAGDTGSISCTALADAALKTGAKVVTSAASKAVYIEGQGVPAKVANWTAGLGLIRPSRRVGGDLITFLPVARFSTGVEDRVMPMYGLPLDLSDLPDFLTFVVQDRPASGDMAVRILDTRDPGNVGTQLTWKITVVNQSPDPASGVGVTGTLDSFIAYDPTASDPAITHDGSPAGGGFTISVGMMQPQEARIFRLVGTVGQPRESVVVTASVSADQVDPVPENNSDSEATRIGHLADLAIEIASNQKPVLTGVPFTVTVTVRNAGPNDADALDLGATLSPNLEFSASDSGFMDAGAGSLTASVPTLAAGASVMLEFEVVPHANGAPSDVQIGAAVTVTGVDQLDPDDADNTAILTLPQVGSAAGYPVARFTTVALDAHAGVELPTTRLPGSLDRLASVTKPYVSSNGQVFGFRGRLADTATTMDEAVVIDGLLLGPVTVAREGVTSLASLGELLGSIDSKLGVNDAGCTAVAARGQGSNRKIALRVCPGGGMADPVVIAVAGQPVPGHSPLVYSFPEQVAIDDDLVVRFVTATTGGPIAQNKMVVETADDGLTINVLQRTGLTVPVNQAGGGMETLQFIDTETDFNRAGIYWLGGGLVLSGDLNGPLATDRVVTLDNAVLFQEGQIADPAFSAPLGSSFGDPYLTGSGDRFVIGINSDGVAWVKRNEMLVGLEGGPVVPGSSERWAGAFRWAIGDNEGRYAIAGATDQGREVVMLHDAQGERLVLTRGDPVDLDGNGRFDDDTFISAFSTAGAAMLTGGRLLFNAALRNCNGTFVGSGMLVADTTGTVEAPTPTPTVTPTPVATATPTSTATDTPTATETATETAPPSETPTPTPTATPTKTTTPTPTQPFAPPLTSTSTPTATDTPTPSPTATETATDTALPSEPPTRTPTATATKTTTPSPTQPFAPPLTSTSTHTATDTPTPSPVPTDTPTPTATETATVTSTATETPVPTATATPTGTATETPTATPIGATLVVTKASVPLDPQDTSNSFSFTSPELGDFTLRPDQPRTPLDGFFALRTFVVSAGTYSITELVPPGWSLELAFCEGASRVTHQGLDFETLIVEIQPGSEVTCAFVDEQRAVVIGEIGPGDPHGEIVVVKDADPADATPFEFTLGAVAGGAPLASFTLSDAAPEPGISAGNVARFVAPPGSYVVSELLPEGWALREIACEPLRTVEGGVLPPHSTPLELHAGETVTCTFRNTKPATLVVSKVSVPLDPQDTSNSFSFTSPELGDFTLRPDQPGAVLDGFSAVETFVVLAGTYTITELIPPGWNLRNAFCDGASRVTRQGPEFETLIIEIEPGAEVACAFVDEQLVASIGEVGPGDPFGEIVIVKEAEPADGTPFDFTVGPASGAAPEQSFVLSHTDRAPGLSPGNHRRFLAAPGTYVVTEMLPEGWDLVDASCEPLHPPGEGTITPTSEAFELRAGETVVCTFRNEKLAQLTVEKVATPLDPADTSATFSFTSEELGPFTLQPRTFDLFFDDSYIDTTTFAVEPGSVTLTEQLRPGWELRPIICLSDRKPALRIEGEASLILTLDPGERVTCTFRNVQVAVPIGDLDPGDPFGEIVVIKEAEPADGTPFEFFLHGGSSPAGEPLATFQLQDTAAGPALSSDNVMRFVVPPGAYVVTEELLDEWELVDLQCDPPKGAAPLGSAAIDVAAGGTVTCTFTNRKFVSLVIFKIALALDADQTVPPFSFASPQLGILTLSPTPTATPGRFAAIGFFTARAGFHTITELVPPGWEVRDLHCFSSITGLEQLGAVATFERTFLPGEGIACTFTNEQVAVPVGDLAPGDPFGQIVVIKEAEPADGTPFDFALNLNASPNADPPLASFRLSDSEPGSAESGGNTIRFAAAPGTYVVTELLPADWRLREVSCEPLRTLEEGAVPPNSATFELRADETVTCTFRNVPVARLTIEKLAQPMHPTDSPTIFAFTGSRIEPFNLRPAQPAPLPGMFTASTTLTVDTGMHTITEQMPPEWSLNLITCESSLKGTVGSRQGDTLTLDLELGEEVHCTFFNVEFALRIGELRTGDPFGVIFIKKQAEPADSTPFDFTMNLATDPLADPPLASFSLRDDDPGQFSSRSNTVAFVAPPGIYLVSELVPAGWVLEGIVCEPSGGGPGPGVLIDLAAGETVACTFTDAKLAKLTVEKRARALSGHGGFQSFAFDSPQLGPFAVSAVEEPSGTPGELVGRSAFQVQRGTFTITERVPPGWTLAGVSCKSPGEGPFGEREGDGVTVDLFAGDDVVCTFVDDQVVRTIGDLAPGDLFGEIVIVKEADPADGTEFAFAMNPADSPDADPPLASFALRDTDAGEGRSATNHIRFLARVGLYVATEQLPAGWRLRDLVCDPPAGVDPGGLPPNSAFIVLANGATVTCTFLNDKLAGRGEACDADADCEESLKCVQNKTCQSITRLTIEKVAVPLDPGAAPPPFSFEIAETLVEGFTLTREATLQPLPDPSGQITARDTFEVLDSKPITVREHVPIGWALKEISCADRAGQRVGVVDGNAVTLEIPILDEVVCRFVNEQAKSALIVAKVARPLIPGDAAAVFPFGSPQLGSFDLQPALPHTADQLFAATVFLDVLGTVAISEAIPSGWVLTDVSCTNQRGESVGARTDATITVSIDVGDLVECLFIDDQLVAPVGEDAPAHPHGEIVIVKDAEPADGTSFAFELNLATSPAAQPPLLGFELSDGDAGGDLSATNHRRFIVRPGTYVVTELVPGGWRLLGISCDAPPPDDAGPLPAGATALAVASGQTVGCRFRNGVAGRLAFLDGAEQETEELTLFLPGPVQRLLLCELANIIARREARGGAASQGELRLLDLLVSDGFRHRVVARDLPDDPDRAPAVAGLTSFDTDDGVVDATDVVLEPEGPRQLRMAPQLVVVDPTVKNVVVRFGPLRLSCSLPSEFDGLVVLTGKPQGRMRAQLGGLQDAEAVVVGPP